MNPDTPAGAAGPPPSGPADVVVALDVGGTAMKCALVDLAGTVRHAERRVTPREQGPAAVVTAILDVAVELTARATALGLTARAVGLAVPGVVDEEHGVAVFAGNLGWRDVPLRKLAADRLELPTALGHDVRAGGLAEAQLGAGRGHRHVLFVAIGTGIASALIVDGQAYPGGHGSAGEFGHIVVQPGGPPCGCGGRGCLEAVASASAVARRYTEQTGAIVSAAEVAARTAAGEPAAAEVWQQTVAVLAGGLHTAITLLDPEVIVLGGGLAEAGDALLVPLATGLAERVTFQQVPVLARAALGDEAGCLGAAILGRRQLDGQLDAASPQPSAPLAAPSGQVTPHGATGPAQPTHNPPEVS